MALSQCAISKFGHSASGGLAAAYNRIIAYVLHEILLLIHPRPRPTLFLMVWHCQLGLSLQPSTDPRAVLNCRCLVV